MIDNELRRIAKEFYNKLDFDKPIAFGHDHLVPNALSSDLYVKNLHGENERDSILDQLAAQIDFAEGSGAYLFTGNRGTGKTTELLRLAEMLRGFGCEVFYCDLSEYLTMTQRIEVSDFLIAMLGAFSEKLEIQYGQNPAKTSFFERIWNFLNSDISFEPTFKIPESPVELKAALRQNPTFKDALQKGTRGHIERLVKQSRDFVLEAVNDVRAKKGDPNAKVVLIVDSVERLRGVGDSKDVHDVFKSAETLFASHYDKLRFSGLSVVYTVPPYLQALAGGLGAYYAGGRVYALPTVHIYQRRPPNEQMPEPSSRGLEKLREIVAKRYPDWRQVFSEDQLSRLAQSSGGDLRDYFRMLRLVLSRVPTLGLPIDDAVLKDAEDAVRGDMLPIAADDRAWLAKIMANHEPNLPSLDQLPEFARLQQGKYVLHYRNGEDWFDVHPLLRNVVD